MSKILIFGQMAFLLFFLANCGGSPNQSEEGSSEAAPGQVEGTANEEGDGPAKEEAPEDFMSNKGVGPVTEVVLGDLDPELAEQGKQLYNTMCIACHRLEEKFIGPAPKGIFKRRSPEWIMNMILNPDGMIKEDPIAKELLVEYNNAPMANQGLTEEQARSILEYFRTLE